MKLKLYFPPLTNSPVVCNFTSRSARPHTDVTHQREVPAKPDRAGSLAETLGAELLEPLFLG